MTTSGFPSPADDHLEGSIDLNEELIRNKASTFCTRVEGELFNDAGIHSGDVLIVDRSITPVDRHVVVAIIDGGFTVRRLRILSEGMRLDGIHGAAPSMRIVGDVDLLIWGVVTYIIHKT